MKKQVTLYTMFMAGVVVGVLLKTLYIDFVDVLPLNQNQNPGCLVDKQHPGCDDAK